MIARVLALLATVAGLLLAVQTLRLADARQQLAQLQTSMEGERAQTARQIATGSERFRTLEKTHRDQLDQLHAETQTALAGAHADADRARAADGRLRQQRAAYLGAAGGGPAHPGATAAHGTPDHEPARVLAELFAAADERAGTLALEADQARARGHACQRQYDSARDMIDQAARHAQTQ